MPSEIPAHTFFGVNFHDASAADVEQWVMETVHSGAKRYVVTPNVDHIVRLHRDAAFRRAYEGAALVLCDSTPLLWSARLAGHPLRHRASSLFVDTCRFAASQELRVFLLGGSPDIAASAAENLKRWFPALEIAGWHHGYFSEDDRVVEEINAAAPDLLFVALGSPKQECWMAANAPKMQINVAFCVGGAFNYVAGAVSRAPDWVQKAGLEWLWRVGQEPRRLWRRYFVDDLSFGPLLVREVARSRRARRRARN